MPNQHWTIKLYRQYTLILESGVVGILKDNPPHSRASRITFQQTIPFDLVDGPHYQPQPLYLLYTIQNTAMVA